MADDAATVDMEDLPAVLCPRVPMYGPSNVRGLTPGAVLRWCTCGLSKTQPWCDDSHRGTAFKPLRWVVPAAPQSLYQLCACKYTRSPPFCDGSHTSLPLKHLARMRACRRRHDASLRLCAHCGWTPGTWLPDAAADDAPPVERLALD